MIYRTGILESDTRLGKDGWNMYKRALSLLVFGSFLFMACFWCVKGMDAVRLASEPVRLLKLELQQLEEKAKAMEAQADIGVEQDAGNQEKGLGIADIAVSGQRIVGYSVMELEPAYDLPDQELDTLLRIVEAEAGNEDEEGKLLVANVVLNRMNDSHFPDSVSEVVFQREKGVSQFSPVANGSFYRVEISEETISAVGRALMGEDISEGALYFVARKYADSSKLKWFDNHLTYLFVHGGHEFFK